MALWNAQGQRVMRSLADTHGGKIELINTMRQKPAFTAGTSQHGGLITVSSTAGQVVFSSNATNDGGQLIVNNADGSAVWTVSPDERGAGLVSVADALGRRRFTAGVNPQGGVARFYGPGDTPTVIAGASATSGGGRVDVFNSQGFRVFSTAADPDGGGQLNLANEAGMVLFSVDTVKDDGALLALMNSAGTRLFLVGSRRMGGLMNLMNGQGNVVLIAGTDEQGMNGAVSIKNGTGREMVHVGVTDADDGAVTVWDAAGRTKRTLSTRR